MREDIRRISRIWIFDDSHGQSRVRAIRYWRVINERGPVIAACQPRPARGSRCRAILAHLARN